MKDSTPIESPVIRTLSLRGLNAYAGCENPGAVSSLDACDNAAASLMSTGQVHCVVVGADRIAANGLATSRPAMSGAEP